MKIAIALPIALTTLLILSCSLVVVFSVSALAQTAERKAEEEKRKAKAAASQTSNVTLKIEAGIVYQQDGPQPLARQVMVLMDSDPWNELLKLPATEGRRWTAKNAAEELNVTCGSSMPEAMDVIKKNTRYAFTTGFDGKAEVADIKPGQYWLFASTKLRRGCAYWLIPVDLTKNASLILDQKNAQIAGQ